MVQLAGMDDYFSGDIIFGGKDARYFFKIIFVISIIWIYFNIFFNTIKLVKILLSMPLSGNTSPKRMFALSILASIISIIMIIGLNLAIMNFLQKLQENPGLL